MEARQSNMERSKSRSLLALTGVAALLAVAANLVISAFASRNNRRKSPKAIPGLNVRVDLSAPEILKLADQIIAKSKQVHDAVSSVPLDRVTYSNVIQPLAELEAQQFPLVQSCVFQKMVSTSGDVRKASIEAERRITAHQSLCHDREDVYRIVKAFAAKGEMMNPEATLYLECLVRDFERNGMHLSSAKRKEMLRLRNQIVELSAQYVQNLNSDMTFILFSEAELLGVPAEFLKNLEKDDNFKFKVPIRSHIVSLILDFCKIGETRKTLADVYGKRCGDVNLPILKKLVQLRHKYARLAGFQHYADYAVNARMPKTSSQVLEFLEDVSHSLTDIATKELQILKELKRIDEGDAPFGIEDLQYYVKRYEEQQFDLDFSEIKKYFPLEVVLSGIYKIFEDLFGLRIEEMPDADFWHSDVQLFSVLDLSSNELLGYFYLDLHKREEKYGHTCVVALQNSSLSSNGLRQVPVALLISQIHSEIHFICNRASFTRFSGLFVDPDLFEIPAQVLENWCYEEGPLKLLSGFYQDITTPIKEETCKSLQKWQHSFAALKFKREILYAMFDQIIYSTENVDFTELFKHLHDKVMLGLPMLEGRNPASCFPRSAIGSEATCYSRLWSEVFAADIFVSKFRDNLFNQHMGMKFRNKVFSPGGARAPMEMLSDVLGRDPSIKAFADRIAGSSI
uniref:Peptidase M3A/M3B catalytic domain-containing protein n=1 Tax=Kalanchoe fedtschenkoi TaxID=63787 RepID=A0A7N0U7R0_KALFE